MGTRYNIYYAGEIIQGWDPDDVRRNLGKLFNAGDATLDKLFSGKAQLLKRDCEAGTAQQYRETMERAGAVAIIREQQTAQVAAPQQAAPAEPTAVREQPAPDANRKLTAAERIAALAAAEDDNRFRSEQQSEVDQGPASYADDEEELRLEPVGVVLLKVNERQDVPPVEVDTSALEVDAQAQRLSKEPPPPPPAPDTSHMDMAEVGEAIPTLPSSAPPLNPDTSALDLSPEGTDFSDCAGPEPIPPAVDLTGLAVAPEGADVLEEQYRNKHDEAAPATDHISLEP